TVAQRRLFEAREAAEDLSQRAAEARAAHAGLVERAGALASEVVRMEEAGTELEQRAAALSVEIAEMRTRVETLRASVVENERLLDVDVMALDGLREDVAAAEEAVAGLRVRTDELEIAIKDARTAHD